jgi:hypothetical protein
MESISLHIGSFELSEPVTALTDLFLSALCLYFFFSLRKYNKLSNSVLSWQLFFVLMSISAFIGVLVHGIRAYQTEAGHHTTWMIMNIIVGIAIYFGQVATMRSILNDSKHRSVYKLIVNLQLLAYLLCIVLMKEFNYNVVKIQVAVGMVPVMIMNFYDYRKGAAGGLWLGLGIGLSFFSGVFHTFKLSINENWFNYNDISHVFLCGCFTLMAYGFAQRMKSIPVVELGITTNP